MAKTIKLKKGKDILIEGMPEKKMLDIAIPRTFAIQPTDFKFFRPKVVVKEGETVKCGTPLFYDKDNENIKFCSPVSGEVLEIERGEKRKVLSIKVSSDQDIQFENFSTNESSEERIKSTMLQAGVWPYITERPYGVLANPENTPRDIFISCFDSSPAAGDYEYMLDNNSADFQKGLDILKKLTEGNIYLGLNAKTQKSSYFAQSTGVEINYFDGPHPAGNVGIQIHHIKPINKNDIVWTLDPLGVTIIGRLFNQGQFNPEYKIAIAGSEFKQNGYISAKQGMSLVELCNQLLKEGNPRIINGNVLTGIKTAKDGFLGFKNNVITAIPEGNQHEFLGWLIPSYPKPSISKTFLNYLKPKKVFKVNTNAHGEERPFVVSGEYEKVLPMDIYPVYLLKSIMAADFEKMENLGIYEVIEEDLALCEFACTSKINVQEILQEGLGIMKYEG